MLLSYICQNIYPNSASPCRCSSGYSQMEGISSPQFLPLQHKMHKEMLVLGKGELQEHCVGELSQKSAARRDKSAKQTNKKPCPLPFLCGIQHSLFTQLQSLIVCVQNNFISELLLSEYTHQRVYMGFWIRNNAFLDLSKNQGGVGSE